MTTAETGRWGEKVAADTLVAAGFGVREQNWRMGHLEIDLIAVKGSTMVFAEVKTRSAGSPEQGIDAVDSRKRRHMIASANAYLQTLDLPYEFRFDIIVVTGTPESYTVEHIPDAFLPSLSTF